jgi:hypothetical protein
LRGVATGVKGVTNKIMAVAPADPKLNGILFQKTKNVSISFIDLFSKLFGLDIKGFYKR